MKFLFKALDYALPYIWMFGFLFVIGAAALVTHAAALLMCKAVFS